MKTESFEKKAFFPLKKKHFSLLFLVLSNMTNVKRQTTRVHIVLWQLLCKWQDVSLEEVGRNNFPKSSCFHDDKSFWPIFPRVIESDKPQGPIDKGPQVVLTITLEIISAFFWDLRGCWKHKILKKGQSFKSRKFTWPIFLLLSSFTNLKEQIIAVRKVFWHLLCKWHEHFFGT